MSVMASEVVQDAERDEVLKLLGEHRVLTEGPVEIGLAAERAAKVFNDPSLNKIRLLRWAREGLLDPAGKRVKLEVATVGGGSKILTSMKAIARLILALNRGRAEVAELPPDAPADPLKEEQAGVAPATV